MVTVLVTVFVFSRPKIVKADVVTLGATGALAALASYLAVSGVSLNMQNVDSTNIQSVFDNLFSGSDDYAHLSDVYGDISVNSGSLILGKQALVAFETLKGFLTGEYSLDSTEKVISSVRTFKMNGLNYTLYPEAGFDSVSRVASIVPYAGGTYYLNMKSQSDGGFWGFRVSITGYDSSRYFTTAIGVGTMASDGVTWSNAGSGSASRLPQMNSSYAPMSNYAFVGFYLNSAGKVGVAPFYRTSSTHYSKWNGYVSTYFPSDLGFVSSSVSGSIDEGYEDFENALNGDLANEAENDDAIGVIGWDIPLDVSIEDSLDTVLDSVIDGTIASTWEGVYSNEQSYEEEKDKPISPELPDGWIHIDGLQDFFPFCIPFDLYYLIDFLNAEPEPLKFDYTISFGGLFDDYTVHIDLSAFNTVAQIFRIMMVIVFAIFLILKTRDLIRG